ncbi:MAG: cation diffusion facilitator family transporter [Gammaproteobacteria bacterium]|nr:cation diffusion facilitator family transporter [Gammaproteobacteria bacterium]MBU1443289.1 cation diffusion facilitator family transporter [Gammaproteobacteria bacterium]MBU2285092.1 cation diffusion facilitator family transporter [Gammaproteobacteria bacterium]MBU2410894.1 cation diffusion facilitator family transporter [Gammaproteobacteria bacterium]
MASGHSHTHTSGQGGAGHERSLWIALILTTSFMVAEVIGGIVTGSLALISDAAHMFTDTAALAISLSAIQISKRAVDAKRTFGYHRFEILAAAFNALLLFGVAIYIVYEAWQRLREPQAVDSLPMLVIASLGLVVNLISMKLLSAGKDGSLNVKGAYLEVWSDMLGSLGVILGAIVIWLTGWTWVDSAIAVGIGFWVLPRTWVLLRDSMNILLEGVPDGIDIAAIEKTLLRLPGVDSIHDLHVWAITTGKPSLSVHIVSATGDFESLTSAASDAVAKDFDIHHSTVQLETTPCEQAVGEHRFS